MIRNLQAISVFGLFLIVATSAQALVLEAVSGKVMINRGAGYEVVNGLVAASPGDHVVVGPGGIASIVYSDDCTIPVEVGIVMTVLKDEPCRGGVAAFTSTHIGLAALGVGAAVAGVIALTKKKKDNPASP